MKYKPLTLFRRFSILLFSLIAVMGCLFIFITYLATTYYHQASTQLLNKEVAGHIAKFTSPFTNKGIDKQRADSVFQNAMVLSPGSEVYFLDTAGSVISFHASAKEIKKWQVDLLPIEQFISAKGEKYIKGTDPKEPGQAKIFSAAKVQEDKVWGYIYVILDSKESETVMDVLFGSHILTLALKAFGIIIFLSLLFSFLYLKRLRKNFDQVVAVLQRFEKGDYEARFTYQNHHELAPVTHAFNKMATLLTETITKLTRSEQERKHFIAMISHDLRTPLSIARGYAETVLLKRDTNDITDAEKEQYLQLIHSKILQIENMVKQLFELSRMDAIAFQPEQEPFVLSEIVQEIINNFQLMAAERKVSLKCTQCLYHVWIQADISMMERVVQNLVENALKNTPEQGFVQVAISVDMNDLVFTIQNNGSPLRDDLLQWINRFSIDAGSPDIRPSKTGLGLLIVQKILLLHRSSLQAYMDNGNVVFSFRIPVYNF